MRRERPLVATAKPLGQKVLSCGRCHSLQPAQPILGGRAIQVQHLRKTAAQIFRKLHRKRHTASTVCHTWQPLAPISHFLGAGWSATIACHPGTNPARRHVQAQSLHRGTYPAADGLSQQAYWHTVQPRMGLNQSHTVCRALHSAPLVASLRQAFRIRSPHVGLVTASAHHDEEVYGCWHYDALLGYRAVPDA